MLATQKAGNEAVEVVGKPSLHGLMCNLATYLCARPAEAESRLVGQ